MKRRYIVSLVVAAAAWPTWAWLSQEPLKIEARQFQKELEAELPIGSTQAAVEEVCRRRGWSLTYAPYFSSYFYLIKRECHGINFKFSFDEGAHLKLIEVTVAYSPDFFC